MAMALGAALALAATGWLAAGDRSTPVFDATGALQSHVLRDNGEAAAASSPAMNDALYEQVLRENRARRPMAIAGRRGADR